MQTKSRNFKDHEIKGILPDGSIYLKDGVTRKRYNDSIQPEDLDPQINYALINFEKAEKYYKYVEGMEDYERD